MKAWELEQVRSATQSRWLARGTRAFTGRICTDSRKAAAGDLFIAIVGQNHDAHAYLPQVIAADVAAVLVHQDLSAEVLGAAQAHGVAVLQTDETIRGLNRLAAAYRATIRAKVIAVGGSNGKTTTKRIIDTVLQQKLPGSASPKSFNNNIGMPLTLLGVDPAHEYVVLEIGTNAPGEIAALGAVCRPDVAVITSIGLEHLEKLQDLAGVAREEAAIAGFVPAGGMMIVPADAPDLLELLKRTSLPRVTVGPEGSGADLTATDVHVTAAGSTFLLNGRTRFRVPLLGEHNVYNALTAVAVARRMGLSEEQIVAGLAKVEPVEMRMELLTVGPHTVLFDAYNANPSSMAAALRTFARMELPAGLRRVAVLGDMLELGAASAAMHSAVGRQAAQAGLRQLVTVGPAMRQAAEAAAAAGLACASFADTAAAAEAAPGLLREPAAVLLKGSRGMRLERVLEALRRAAPDAALAAT